MSLNTHAILHGFRHLGSLLRQLNEEDFSVRPIILRKQSGMRVFLAIFLEDADKTKFANPVS